MQNILLNVDGMSITLIDKPEVLTLNRNILKAEFNFSDEWVGVKTALFLVDGVTYSVLIEDDNACDIPEECYGSKRLQFAIGVICGNLITTNSVKVYYDESCYTSNTSIPEPTEDIYTQIIEKINNLGSDVVDENGEVIDLDNYYNKDEVDKKLEEIEVDVDFSNYYDKTSTDELLINKADKTEIPTKASQLENDEGYINIITNSMVYDEVTDVISSEVNGVKADVNLDIVRNPRLPMFVNAVDDLEIWSDKALIGSAIYVIETSTYWVYNPSEPSDWKDTKKSFEDVTSGIIDDRDSEKRSLNDTLNTMEDEIRKTYLVQNLTPVGDIISFMGKTAPKDYLICDGMIYNIADYTELAEHINTNFGTYNFFGGDGTTTFGVPDMRGLFTRGYGGASGEIGAHQDGTEFPYIYGHTNNRMYYPESGKSYQPKFYDNITDNMNGTTRKGIQSAIGTEYTGILNASYTARPDNMAVLYCIKYTIGEDLSKTINQKSTFMVNVNGQQNNWNANDPNTSFSPTVTNKWQNIPAKFNVLVDNENSNKATYYMSVADDLEGVELAENISELVKSIDLEIMAFLQNQVWYNSSLRLVAHAPDCLESEYMGDSFNFSEDTILLAEEDFIASNNMRNGSFNGRRLHTILKNTETGEKITRDGWVLRFQMRTDNTQDYISDKSFVTITFNDR